MPTIIFSIIFKFSSECSISLEYRYNNSIFFFFGNGIPIFDVACEPQAEDLSSTDGRHLYFGEDFTVIYSSTEIGGDEVHNPLKYLSFLLEHRPSTEMSDEELEQFAPWSELAQETCK